MYLRLSTLQCLSKCLLYCTLLYENSLTELIYPIHLQYLRKLKLLTLLFLETVDPPPVV